MPILVTATKGGAGATVIAASIGLAARTNTVLIDLDGDLTSAINATPDGPVGLDDWLRSDAPAARLDELALDVTDSCRLAPWMSPAAGEIPIERWRMLAEWIAECERAGCDVIVDVGVRHHPIRAACGAETTQVMVTRACFLALRRANDVTRSVDGVVLIDEPGRSLTVRDIERTLGRPVLARLRFDPAVARGIDAGLHQLGLPKPMRRAGAAVLAALGERQRGRRGAA